MALFTSGSPDAAKPRPGPAPADLHNIIGKGTVIEGTLRSSGNVHVSGTVVGNVAVEGRTVVMPGGVVEGEVVSTSAEIGGRIRGEVRVAERLVLKATAVVEGDIRTAKLVIEDGAVFTGRCEMAGVGAPERPSAGRLAPEASVREVPAGEQAPARTREMSVETARDPRPADGSRLTRRLGGPSLPNGGREDAGVSAPA